MQRVTLVQLGIGTVGGEAVAQVLAQRERWRREMGLDLVLGAVAGRDGALVAEDLAGLAPERLTAAVAGRRAGRGLGELAELAGGALVPAEEAVARLAAAGPVVVMDAAAGEETAPIDARALASGAGVVLSNKAPLALPGRNPLTAELWAAAGPRGRLRYEATCGAGLPVISTLRGLLDTGDEPIAIVGALSGTLGAIFSDIAAGQLFSAAVRRAKAQGFTEPDPRDDLSGLDVARKGLILARTLGRDLDLDQIEIENLVPAALRDVPVAEFLARLDEADAPLAARAAAAEANGASLKYLAVVRPDGPLAVGVREVKAEGVLGAVHGPENVVSIRTRRYDAHPLTVIGPGAGPAVTAAGMLADALAVADILVSAHAGAGWVAAD